MGREEIRGKDEKGQGGRERRGGDEGQRQQEGRKRVKALEKIRSRALQAWEEQSCGAGRSLLASRARVELFFMESSGQTAAGPGPTPCQPGLGHVPPPHAAVLRIPYHA